MPDIATIRRILTLAIVAGVAVIVRAQSFVLTGNAADIELQRDAFDRVQAALDSDDYEAAYHHRLRLLEITDSLNAITQSVYTELYATKHRDQKLKSDAARIAMERAELEHARLEQQHSFDRLTYQNSQEQLVQQRLRMRQQADEHQLRKQRQEQERLRYESQVNQQIRRLTLMRIFTVVLAIIILLAAMLTLAIEGSRRRLRAQRAKADHIRAEARQSADIKVSFLRRMRNDIRDPLANVSTTVGALAECKDAKEREWLLADLHRSARQIIELFEDAAKERGASVVAALFLLLSLPHDMLAQSAHEGIDSTADALHISPEAFAVYRRAQKHLDKNVLTTMADTMMDMGIRDHNKKTQVMAIYLRAQHAYITGDVSGLRQQLEHITAESRGTLEEWMTFNVWGDIVDIFIERDDIASAMSTVRECQKVAAHANNIYGIANTMIKMGDIMCMRGMLTTALDLYTQARDLMLTDDLQRDLSIALTNIGRTQLRLGNHTDGIDNLRQALVHAVMPRQRMTALNELFAFYTDRQKIDTATLYKKQLEATAEMLTMSSSAQRSYHKTCARYWTLRGNLIRAKLYLDSIGNAFPLTHTYYYAKTGNYQRALQWLERAAEERDRLLSKTNTLQLGAFKADLDNALAEEENMRQRQHNILLDNAKLRSNARLQQLRHKADSMQIRRGELEMAEQTNRIAMEEQEQQRRQLEQEEALAKARFRVRIYIGIGVAVTAILVFTLIVLYRRRLAQRRMRLAVRRMEIAGQLAVKANEEKADFIHQMSHEVRTPLNALQGFADMLYGPMADEAPLEGHELKMMQDTLQQNLAMLGQLISEVTELSEWDDGRRELHPRPTDITVIMRDVSEAWAPTNGVSMCFDIPESRLVCETDPYYLGQVLGHLMSNATKFTTQGNITLACRQIDDSGYVAIAVTNTAPPIPADKTEFIFRRFAKLDTFQQGLGLGLSLCRVIVAAMHGTLYLDTYYTDGVRFVLELPPRITTNQV